MCIRDRNETDEAKEGDKVTIVLDKTVFYAESGGQIGDSGVLVNNSSTINVNDCKKSGGHFLHFGYVQSGSFHVGDKVQADIHNDRRQLITCNHSATHLLHEALREVLGDHVEQRGSLVDEERFRFDFSHDSAVTDDEIRQVEHIVNEEILKNKEVVTNSMSMEEAKSKGAKALFGEKYGDVVRVVNIGDDFSVELCGGTHVSRTGEIGLVKVAVETSVAAGIRRIESYSGMKAVDLCNEHQDQITAISGVIKGSKGDLSSRIQNLLDENKSLHREIKNLKQQLASSAGSDLMEGLQELNGISVLTKIIDDNDVSNVRAIADQVRGKLTNGVFFLAGIGKDRAALVAGVTGNLTDRINASALMKHVASQVDGKGGGRPDMAQGVANNIENIQSALDSVFTYLKDHIT